jgi:hypothetical protein
MKRLDDVSKPTEIPFPASFTYQFNTFLGRNVTMPNKFEAIAKTYDFGLY